jgi:hypothetical protein
VGVAPLSPGQSITSDNVCSGVLFALATTFNNGKEGGVSRERGK